MTTLYQSILQSTFTIGIACIVFFTIGCAHAADTSIHTHTKQKNYQVDNLATIVKNIPSIGVIKNSRMHIDFLQNVQRVKDNTHTVQANNNIQNNANILLGRRNGENIIYTPQITNFSTLEAKTQNTQNNEIITYNYNRDILGVFYGKIDIVLQDAQYLNEVLTTYNATVVMHSDIYATIVLNDIHTIADAYRTMENDTKIVRIKIDLNENTISLH